MQWFQREKREETEEAGKQAQQEQAQNQGKWVPNRPAEEPKQQEKGVSTRQDIPSGPPGARPQPSAAPERQQPPPSSAPRRERLSEGGNQMNPSARERLPYPDLPIQNSERSSGRVTHERAVSARTLIDRDSQFNGTFRSDSDLLIEGTFEGEIDCKGTVTVAEGASVSATVQARNVVIAGSANGEVTCEERFTIVATGEMRGKAQAATLVVEEGAVFEGEFKMGAGGFSSVGASNFSSWQTPRLPKNGSSRQEKENVDDTTELEAVDADASKAEGDQRSEEEPPTQDAWR